MKKEIIVEENLEVNETQEEVVETKPDGIVTRGVKCIKRNGKKIGKGVGLVVGGLMLYSLGKSVGAAKSSDCDEDYEASEEADFEPEDIEAE